MAPQKSNLQVAAEIIHGDREQTHGDPSKNLSAIAAYWNTYLQQKFGFQGALTAEDVCVMMIQLKVARLGSNPTHKDSWIDIAGYVGLQDRITST